MTVESEEKKFIKLRHRIQHDVCSNILSLKMSIDNFEKSLSDQKEFLEELHILLSNMQKQLEKNFENQT